MLRTDSREGMNEEKLEEEMLGQVRTVNSLLDGRGWGVGGGGKCSWRIKLQRFTWSILWEIFYFSMLGKKGNLFYDSMNMLYDHDYVVQASELLEHWKSCLSWLTYNPPRCYRAYQFILCIGCVSCQSGAHAIQGLWWGLRRREKKYKYCTDWSPELVTAACQAYSERYNKSALSAFSTTTLDHLQIYTTTHCHHAFRSLLCVFAFLAAKRI